jgi:hypothetical protein
MAFWDSASIHSNRTSGSLLRAQRDIASTDVSYVQTEVTDKWHPGTTLAFIVVTCSLLWGGIFLAVRFLF